MGFERKCLHRCESFGGKWYFMRSCGFGKKYLHCCGSLGKMGFKGCISMLWEKSVILCNPILFLSQLLIVKNLMRMRLSSKV